MPEDIPELIKGFIAAQQSETKPKHCGGGDSSNCYQYKQVGQEDLAVLVVELKGTQEQKEAKKQELAKNIRVLKKLGRLKEEYYDEANNKHYIVQKYLGDKTVRYETDSWVDKGAQYKKIEEKLLMAIKIATSLQQIHQQGIIHGDLHGANIMYPGGHIIDFDHCVELSEGETSKKSPRIKSQEHIAPEWRDDNQALASYSADIYSLGALFGNCDVGGGFLLHENETDYGDNISEVEKKVIQQFIARMKANTPEQRPNIEQVIDFFTKVEAKHKDSAAATIEMPAGLGIPTLKISPVKEDAEPLVQSLLTQITWEEKGHTGFKLQKIESISKDKEYTGKYLSSVTANNDSANIYINITNTELECPQQTGQQDKENQAQAIVWTLQELKQVKEKTSKDPLIIETEDFDAETLQSVIDEIRKFNLGKKMKFICNQEDSAIKKLIAEYDQEFHSEAKVGTKFKKK